MTNHTTHSIHKCSSIAPETTQMKRKSM
uniref:Uncharacterized protein n=1 Tax=Anguilla anguilla TaxID=7936 RepID=A0A0E9UDJ5_ANGAN